ncbi:MAG: IS1 family transposase [Leptolyngbyaceae cyanobacterium]
MPHPLWYSAVLHRQLVAYSRQLVDQHHPIVKTNPQKIERKHCTWRTRIQCLARKAMGFSKSVLMPDTGFGMLINRYKFGRAI